MKNKQTIIRDSDIFNRILKLFEQIEEFRSRWLEAQGFNLVTYLLSVTLAAIMGVSCIFVSNENLIYFFILGSSLNLFYFYIICSSAQEISDEVMLCQFQLCIKFSWGR